MVLINLLTNSFRVPLTNRTLATTFFKKPCKMYIQRLQQLRLKSFKVQCKNTVPKCGDRFAKKPCEVVQVPPKLKQPAPEPLPYERRSIKGKTIRECCGDPCIDAFPRFDTLYYKRTDKLNREYPRTWCECPAPAPKRSPCPGPISPPDFKKRPRKQVPETACTPICARKNPDCAQIQLPGCRNVRMPPKCKPPRPKSLCRKRRSPQPAFSECLRAPASERPPVECRCLLRPTMCEVWAYHHYVNSFKKVGLC